MLPGAAMRISPPTAPPTTPARPPPIDAPAHRAAAMRAARRKPQHDQLARACATAPARRGSAPARARRRPSACRAAARARTRGAAGCRAAAAPPPCRARAGARRPRAAPLPRRASLATRVTRCSSGSKRSAERSGRRRSASARRRTRRAATRRRRLPRRRRRRRTGSRARHGADEARLARVVAERAADGANRLAQRAVGDDDVAPDAIEDVAAMHRLVAVLDQEDEQIEIARDERLLAPVADEHAAPRREDELAEAIAGHVFSVARGRQRPAIVSQLRVQFGYTLGPSMYGILSRSAGAFCANANYARFAQ